MLLNRFGITKILLNGCEAHFTKNFYLTIQINENFILLVFKFLESDLYTKVCAWYARYATMACKKNCNNLIIKYWITVIQIFYGIGSIHYCDAIMSGIRIVYSTICSGADHRKHQSSTSLAFVRGIHWWPVNSLHKRPVTWKMFPFDDVIMILLV